MVKAGALALAAVWLGAAVHLAGQAGVPAGPATSRVTPSDPLLAQASSLVRAGNLEGALPVIRQFLAQHPNSPDGHAVLAFIFFKQSKPAEALREYGETAKRRPPSAFEAKIMGLSAAMLKDYASADLWLSKSHRQDPHDLEACSDLGQAKFIRGKYGESVDIFRECLQLDARNVYAENGVGSAYERLGRWDEAAAAYRKIISWQASKTPEDPTPYWNLGRVLQQQNKPKEAVIYLTRAVELGPDEAEVRARQFLETTGDAGNGHALLGFIRFVQQRWRESRAEFEEASQHRALSAVEFKMLGLDCLALDLYADAEKWLTRSIEIESGDAGAWEGLGEARAGEQQFDAAIVAYQRSLALNPRNPSAETGVGWCSELLSRLEDAATAYKTAIGWEVSKPDDPTPYLGLGRVLVKLNRPAEALPYLQQVVRMDPSSAEAHEELGKAHTATNDLLAAQQEIEKAIELAPHVARLHFMLGQLFRRTGQMEKAKAELDAYATMVGTHSTTDQNPR